MFSPSLRVTQDQVRNVGNMQQWVADVVETDVNEALLMHLRSLLCCLQGNDEVFRFLEVVFDQVVSQFPCQYLHIGGDEVPKARWEECDKCQERMTQVTSTGPGFILPRQQSCSWSWGCTTASACTLTAIRPVLLSIPGQSI